MLKDVESNIKRFYDFFWGQKDKIGKIEGESGLVFKKTLYCSLLDAVSRSVYPQKGNCDRFTECIKCFGEWEEYDLISLPHLERLLLLSPEPQFEALRKYVFDRIRKWRVEFDVISLNKDLSWKEVMKYWPKGNEYQQKEINRIRLENIQHIKLLYAHRNALVHEFRNPGAGMDFGDEDKPFYHHLSTISNISNLRENYIESIESFELVYPEKFFQGLCEAVLRNLREYFEKNRLNPFDYYKFGSFWLEDLN